MLYCGRVFEFIKYIICDMTTIVAMESREKKVSISVRSPLILFEIIVRLGLNKMCFSQSIFQVSEEPSLAHFFFNLAIPKAMKNNLWSPQ